MKTVLILCVLVFAAVSARPGEFYDQRYDNFNAEELVENIRLLKNYGKCFLAKGPCTAEGAEFKKVIPEALKTNCGKCSPKQRKLVRITVKGFQAKLPEVWDELVKKEDPHGEFTESFNNFLNQSD